MIASFPPKTLFPHEDNLLKHKGTEQKDETKNPSKQHIDKESRHITTTRNKMCRNSGGKPSFQKLEKGNFMFIDSKGVTRGLSILWNPTIITMEKFYSTRWTLSTSYRLIGTNKTWPISNVYGPQDIQEK